MQMCIQQSETTELYVELEMLQQQNNETSGSATNVRGQILGVTLLPFPGLGAIISLETSADNNQNLYRITMGMYPSCTCPDFTNMVILAIGGQQQYVNCKHLYYLYHYFYKMDIHDDKFIHVPSYSFNELKLLLVRTGIITIPE